MTAEKKKTGLCLFNGVKEQSFAAVTFSREQKAFCSAEEEEGRPNGSLQPLSMAAYCPFSMATYSHLSMVTYCSFSMAAYCSFFMAASSHLSMVAYSPSPW